jgi:hypothetical protein
MPALQAFCIQASVAIVFNYLFQITAFVVALVYDCERRKAGRTDILCCLPGGEEPGPKEFWKKKFGGKYYQVLKTKGCGFAVLGVTVVLLGLAVTGILMIPVGLS